MSVKHNISTLYKLFLVSTISLFSLMVKGQDIEVYAGADTSICQSSSLDLNELNAYISGLVNDGYWFTLGDGFFNPGAGNNVLFSIGQTYYPGPNDIVQGYVDLILSSLDPDGNGPGIQVNDTVRITLSTSPPLACHNQLNVSLNNNCEEYITAEMLLTNPTPPFSHYIIELIDQNGNTIPDNIINVDHLDEYITFTVGHSCGNSTCSGTILAQDKNPPILQCANHTIDCTESTTPDSLSFPINDLVTLEHINDQNYLAYNLDACGPAEITYTDIYQDMNCLNGLQGRIIRTWSTSDESNNTNSCTQVISIRTLGLDDVIFPPHYNDVEKPSLHCDENWPKLANGYPHPDYTGSPLIDGCKKVESTYTDLPFELCGGSYKLLRKWLVIDWCSNETTEFNQVIKIDDVKAPQFTIIDSLKIGSNAYNCFSDLTKLPSVTNIIDCSEVDTFFVLHDTFGISYSDHVKLLNDSFYIDSLPVGTYIGSYILIDECANKDTNSLYIEVYDDKAPFPICDQFTKVSITNNGFARLFAESIDDNSVDNCAIDYFEVAKMEDSCGGTINEFGPHVDFCCLETQAPIMVALRVTDIYGNNNTCMSQVTIEDKEAPTLSCPSNLTISCDYNFDISDFGTISLHPDSIDIIYLEDEYNMGVAGSNGLATDNCGVVLDSSYTANLECNVGLITRVFTASDYFGNETSCQQTIHVVNLHPFDQTNITWPSDVELDGCDTSSIVDIALTKKPLFDNEFCANVESTYEDQFFINTNEACVKILRYWSVIDWCSFDSNTGDGLYQYVQIIKLNNTVAPEITTACSDTVFCQFSPDCGEELYLIHLNAIDDCTPTDKLSWNWSIDQNHDGIIEFQGTSDSIKANIGPGNYHITVRVFDQCGNESSCEYDLEARDCKNPTPYCASSITTVIMPSSKELTIAAEGFDLNSFDNCTSSEELKFSFSENKADSTMLLTCEDISDGISQVIPLKLYVFDQNDNYDFCAVELLLQDNNDVCEDETTFKTIEGIVTTWNGKSVKSVEVNLTSDIITYDQSKLTNSVGQFTFSDLPSNLNYTISSLKEEEAIEGVSTFDLIILQRHILKIQELNSPYQYLAGDANGSNKLSVSDLVAIRKVILGLENQFPNNVPNWQFYDASYEIEDPQRPWSITNEISLSDITNDNQANFIGIKTGDVNGSYSKFSNGISSENRSTTLLDIIHKSDSHTEIIATEDWVLDGFQLSIDASELHNLTFHTSIKDHVEYSYQNDVVKIICYLPYHVEISEGEILFEINGKDIIPSTQQIWPSEIYINEEVYEVNYRNDNSEILENSSMVDVQVMDRTLLLTPTSDEMLAAHIYDMSGRLVDQWNFNHTTYKDLAHYLTGVYVVRIVGKSTSMSEKFYVP